MQDRTNERLKPTLWRTCRTLANRTRLRMLSVLLAKPGLSVSELAHRFKMNLPVTSKYLRELNARGLLLAKRNTAEVRYWPKADHSVPQARSLLDALSESFRVQESPMDFIFRKATAFTHPRRITIIRQLLDKPATFQQIRSRTDMSKTALLRHLGKLQDRGFVDYVRQTKCYTVVAGSSSLKTALLKLADDE